MKHVIVGTAGHIDHGKTALVKALTGIDTDRLEEEKRRGISIELGFAHLELGPDLRLGFVDVPGHERFVKNMLAGAWGIDLVLLVVAADESIKPQTREHFEICRLLGIRRGLVALTKADLVEPDLLELVRLEIEEFLAGSFLEGAPILAVSSLTGEGLAELRQALAEMAARTPEKDATRHFRLPVDRSFSMRGFGTVVTGTLMSGSVTREQELEAHPGGRRLRVRGIQVHGQPVERALAGQRTALNLAGAEPAELPRGTVLTAPGLFRPVKQLDCRLELLASARPLKHRAPVHFHAGTAEVQAEVRLLEGQTLAPGAQAWARLVLREPVLVLPGDRFIIRMFSPVVTIGGGLIVDIGGRRYRSGEPAGERLSTLAWGELAQRIALLVREAPYGMSPSALIARTGWMPAEIEEAARRAGLFVLRKPELWLADRAWLERAIAALREALETFHRRNPLQPGMPKQELRARLLPRAPAFLLDALIEQSGGALVAEGEAVRLAGHRVRLAEQEEQALAAIEQAFQSAGLAVPATSEALAKSGLPPARARELLQILIRRGKLLRLGDELVFHADALEGLRALLARHRGERFSVARFKDLTGISRKYAIPLLEYLDRERVTRREGDERIVL